MRPGLAAAKRVSASPMTFPTVVGDFTRRCPRSRLSSGLDLAQHLLELAHQRLQARAHALARAGEREASGGAGEEPRRRAPPPAGRRAWSGPTARRPHSRPAEAKLPVRGGEEERLYINELAHARVEQCPAPAPRHKGVWQLPRRRSAGARRFAFAAGPRYQAGGRERSGRMILYPAIDLKDGQCVRLLRGAMDQRDGLRRGSGGAGAGLRGGRAAAGCISSTSTAPSPGGR